MFLVATVVCWLVLILAAGPLPAASPVLIQKQGPASLYLDAPQKDGQVEIALSDLLEVTLRVEGPKDMELEPPAPITRSPGWEITVVGKPVFVVRDDGRQGWDWVVTLTPLIPGDNPLQIEPLRYRQARGEFQTATWKLIPIKVVSLASADLKNLRDPTSIEESPRPEKSTAAIWWIVGLVVGIGALVGFLVVPRRWRRPAPPLTADQAAGRDLDRILAMHLPEKGHVNRFHTLLANVVRRYLEKTRHIPARRQTTAEFLAVLEQSPGLPADQQAFLRDFLERCDLAKFAAATVTPEECRRLAERVRGWLESEKRGANPGLNGG